MNDAERRLRDLGETARNDVTGGLRPRPEALRRIGRRRTALTAGALACAAAVFAAGAFAWSGTAEDPPVRPADVAPSPPLQSRVCTNVPFTPGWVPEGFDERPRLADERRPGLIATFRGDRGSLIEVKTPHHELVQTRPRSIRVLGEHATIGLIHEGYSVELYYDVCEYVLNGYGVTRSELKRFAERLEPGQHLGTIWPLDDFVDAANRCAVNRAERDDPAAVAESFLRAELGWDDPILVPPERRSDPWVATRGGPKAYGAAPRVELMMTEVVPRCWSVHSVGEYARDHGLKGVEVSVRGRWMTIAVAPRQSLQVIADVRYGLESPIRQSIGAADGRPNRIDLGSAPREAGRLLLHFQGPDKGPVYAIGVALPPGDFHL